MKKVLIVEDHADIRRLIRMTLELDDHEIHEAADAAAGLEAARRLLPDVVLLDVMLPGGMDGLAVCRALRADPALRRTAIVMLSALGSGSDRENGLEAGADAYLVKPFSPLNLIETIDSLVKS
ncbi:MAG: response regulator [Burkholderiales bacterium]|nr:response regulator [Burkholderiales bacterium]MDE2396557.1 response regulator [Burkholderiales bacterium]MDE2453687.1 response regulator [Burkholderiales bacterium]